MANSHTHPRCSGLALRHRLNRPRQTRLDKTPQLKADNYSKEVEQEHISCFPSPPHPTLRGTFQKVIITRVILPPRKWAFGRDLLLMITLTICIANVYVIVCMCRFMQKYSSKLGKRTTITWCEMGWFGRTRTRRNGGDIHTELHLDQHTCWKPLLISAGKGNSRERACTHAFAVSCGFFWGLKRKTSLIDRITSDFRLQTASSDDGSDLNEAQDSCRCDYDIHGGLDFARDYAPTWLDVEKGEIIQVKPYLFKHVQTAAQIGHLETAATELKKVGYQQRSAYFSFNLPSERGVRAAENLLKTLRKEVHQLEKKGRECVHERREHLPRPCT